MDALCALCAWQGSDVGLRRTLDHSDLTKSSGVINMSSRLKRMVAHNRKILSGVEYSLRRSSYAIMRWSLKPTRLFFPPSSSFPPSSALSLAATTGTSAVAYDSRLTQSYTCSCIQVRHSKQDSAHGQPPPPPPPPHISANTCTSLIHSID